MTRTKKLFAGLLAALMVLAVLPVASFAAEVAYQTNEAKELKRWDDIWAVLDPVEAEMMAAGANRAEVTYAVYKAALNCPLIDEGSITDLSDNEFSFTTHGMWGGYNYRVRNYTKAPARQTNEALNYEIAETVAKVNSGKGNAPTNGAVDVLLVGPYYGSDSSFTDQYKTEANSIAAATGGTRTMLSGSQATGPNIASNYNNKAVVIYDSHGNCISSKQTSYLDLTSSTGLTTSDYNNGWAYNGGSFYGIDGRYIQNHHSGTITNTFVWMAICEGMKKEGKGTTGTALLAAGCSGVYGYSQSVSFTGDYKYEAVFWTQMKNGATVAEALQVMKNTYGVPDPVTGGDAYPIVMSPVDAFPSNPDGAQTVYLDWTLFGEDEYTVTAVSNNTNYGTVSVDGYTITASPKTGYYAAGYTVTSGTATVSQNGNIFTVTPSSDCTVRINFAAKTQNTVNFIASGTSQGSQTAYTGDSITLPATVTVNPTGWSFVGWVGNQVSETTTKPTYYAPGASYTVNGNATLYALYTRVEGSGEVVYQQSDSIEIGGKYAITIGNYAVSNTVYNTSLNHYVTSQSVTISGSNLTVASSVNVNTILYEVESGTAAAGYVFKNVANSKYLTLGSDEYLIVGDTPLAWLWANGDLNNQIDSEGYYYLSRSSHSTYFTTSKNTQGTIVLYKEVALGTTYYNTDPVAAVTYYTVTFKDWDGSNLKIEQVEAGGSATAPANPTREGYTFTGWDTDFTNVQSNLTVTAQYTINTYTVTFKDWDGTVLKTQTVNYGGSATAPTVPGRVGYTFTGWDRSFTNVTSNLIVTAQYTINTYTVTFKDWDGTVLKTQTVNYGAAATAPTVPGREGYTFIGWDRDFSNVTSNLIVTALYQENTQPGNLVGDVNCDGYITSADISALFAYIMNAGSLTDQGVINADLNGDGVITSADVTLLAQLIFG